MPDDPVRGSDLYTPAPTLEPDDVLVARLSSLAAARANASPPAAAPLATWRVGLAALSVAAVLVGIAWLTGLHPSGSPNPAPPPTTRPSAPDETSGSTAPSSGTSTSEPGRSPATVAPSRVTSVPERPDHQGATGSAEQGDDHVQEHTHGPGNGPNEHAGNHPNEHATTKSNHRRPHSPGKPDRGARGRSGR
jgi:hypothetical protein